ncbi:MAG: hypothetical protein WCO33_05260 [bacterium]
MFNEILVSERDSAKPIKYIANPKRFANAEDTTNYTATMYWEPHPTHGEKTTAADWKTMLAIRDVLTNLTGKNLTQFNLLLGDSHANQLGIDYYKAMQNLMPINEMANDIFGNKYNGVWLTNWYINLEMAPTTKPKLTDIYLQEQKIVRNYLMRPQDILLTLMGKEKVCMEDLYTPVTILYLRARRKSGTQFVLNAPWEFV